MRDLERTLARREAKRRRDALLEKLLDAERRGDSARLTVLRAEVSRADRDARGAA